MTDKKEKGFLYSLGVLSKAAVFTAIVVAVWAFVFQWLWNWVMPPLGFPYLSTWRVVGIYLVCWLFFWVPFQTFVKRSVKNALKDIAKETTTDEDIEDIKNDYISLFSQGGINIVDTGTPSSPTQTKSPFEHEQSNEKED